mmetsp:Transcript_29098/g.67692  ORF Transcript_29098/g.67692 Transcript_29098/m.67692 type:complete len:226 (+) Transcript_29098:68-745(+)
MALQLAIVLGVFASVPALVVNDKPGACACLNWNDVYSQEIAECGDAGELIVQGRNLLKDTEFCGGEAAFFKNQSHEYCINFEKVRGPQRLLPGAWCYVSASCHQLRGGSVVNSRVHWKICTPGKDPVLGDLEPAKLFGLARENGKNHRDTALMAYSWKEVKGMFPKQPTLTDMAMSLAGQVGMMKTSNNKTALTVKRAENTIEYKGQIWEVMPTRAVCLEGCPEA